MENQKKVFDGMQMYFCEYIKKYVYLCPDTLTEQYFNGISPFPDVPEAFFIYVHEHLLVLTLNFFKNSGCLVMSVANISELICDSRSRRMGLSFSATWLSSRQPTADLQ